MVYLNFIVVNRIVPQKTKKRELKKKEIELLTFIWYLIILFKRHCFNVVL